MKYSSSDVTADGVDRSFTPTPTTSTVTVTVRGSTAHGTAEQATSNIMSHSEVMVAFLGPVRETVRDEICCNASIGQEATAVTAVQVEEPPNTQSTVPTATNAVVNSQTGKLVIMRDV